MSNSENSLNYDYSNPYEAFIYAGMCLLIVAGALAAFEQMRRERNSKYSKLRLRPPEARYA